MPKPRQRGRRKFQSTQARSLAGLIVPSIGRNASLNPLPSTKHLPNEKMGRNVYGPLVTIHTRCIAPTRPHLKQKSHLRANKRNRAVGNYAKLIVKSAPTSAVKWILSLLHDEPYLKPHGTKSKMKCILY